MKNVILFILLCSILLGSSEKCEEPNQHDTPQCNNVTVGNHTYSNVTEKWTPRVGETGRLLAILIPTTYAAVVLVILLLVRRNTFGVYQIKRLYYTHKVVIYFKHYCGDDLYQLITGTPDSEHEHYEMFNKPDNTVYLVYCKEGGLYVEDPTSYLPPVRIRDQHEQEHWPLREGYGVRVTAKTLKKTSKILEYIPVQPAVKLTAVIVAVICAPLLKVVLDVADVAADCYYYSKLEGGQLIDENIFRNGYVINGILVFAVMGCLKNSVMAYGYSRVVDYSMEEADTYRTGRALFIKPIVVCMKIILEDAGELVLEYYFADKFITENPPWLFVFKDIVAAIIYTIPIYTVIKSWNKNYKKVKQGYEFRVLNMRIKPADWLHVYIACVIIHVTFSVACVTRVAGMIYQYARVGYINSECLAVVDGRLLQTPFTQGCLNGFDYIILACIGIIGILCVFIILFVFPRFVLNFSKFIGPRMFYPVSKWIGSTFNKPLFVISGVTTVGTRSVRTDKVKYSKYDEYGHYKGKYCRHDSDEEDYIHALYNESSSDDCTSV